MAVRPEHGRQLGGHDLRPQHLLGARLRDLRQLHNEALARGGEAPDEEQVRRQTNTKTVQEHRRRLRLPVLLLPVDEEEPWRLPERLVEEGDAASPAGMVGKPEEAHGLPRRQSQRVQRQVVREGVTPDGQGVKVDSDGRDRRVAAVLEVPAKPPPPLLQHLHGSALLALVELRRVLRPEGPRGKVQDVAAPDRLEGRTEEPALQPPLRRASGPMRGTPGFALLDELRRAQEDVPCAGRGGQALCDRLLALHPPTHEAELDVEGELAEEQGDAQNAKGQEEVRDCEGKDDRHKHAPGEDHWRNDHERATDRAEESEQGPIDELWVEVIEVAGADVAAGASLGRIGARPRHVPQSILTT
mmetsp:Transcript_24328/g.72475  ORF Transcript_24328/g.72475 Transcript_24328/m.72475 type:complete len:358 (-) Transcript_24328:18-1091(-)